MYKSFDEKTKKNNLQFTSHKNYSLNLHFIKMNVKIYNFQNFFQKIIFLPSKLLIIKIRYNMN
jgi:hypothetical protein